MSWTNFFIKRPVFSISLAALLVFVGIFGYINLPLRLFPQIESTIINISVDYPGATANTMESFVTNTIQSSLTGISDINYLSSSSRQGHADISVFMNVGANADTALTMVMQKIASIRGQLPKGIENPIINKAESDDNPILLFAVTSQVLSNEQISDYLNRTVKPQLESVDGVASAQVLGEQYAMRLWLNPIALAAHHLTMTDVLNSLNHQNVQSTVGSLDGKTQQNITLNSELNDETAFNNLIIKQGENTPVRLRDIGEAKLGNETNKITAFYNGKPAVMILVKPMTSANPLSIVSGIEKILPKIKQQFPNKMEMNTAVNASTFIKASIYEVIKTMLEGTFVVALVIFLFLRNLRAVCVPLITIPLSLISVCFLLMLLGYSINLLTLLAMVIAIGLVVDDAIIVMENIHRYKEKGHSIFDAAIIGTKEIYFSIIAMTATLAAIFAPIAFSSGISGKLFSEFAWCLAGSVIISGVIALTLSPMMCTKLMSDIQTKSKFMTASEIFFTTLKQYYLRYLEKTFYFKKSVLFIWFISIIGCLYFYESIPGELAPKEDQGFLQVIATAPDSTNSAFLANNSVKLNSIYQSIPEIQSSIYINGIPSEHQVLSFIHLTPWDSRNLSSLQLQPILQSKLNQIAALQAFSIIPAGLPGSQGFPVEFVIKTIGSYEQLYDASKQLMQRARQSGLFLFVNNDLNYDQPVLEMKIDRSAASAIGVNIDDISATLATALNENKVQYFNLSNRSYEVIPQIYKNDRLNPDQLNNLYVNSKNNTLVPLSSLITMKTVTEPASLNQFQKFNSVTISGVMAPDHTLSEGLSFLNNTAKTILPQNMNYDYAGNSRQFISEGHRMLWLFLAAFIVIFIVLAMQFESFRDPFIILLGSLPMSLMAAMLPLKLGFSTMNIYTQIGLMALAGLVCKHGILLTKFANVAQKEGCHKYEAIIQAADVRFRPIIMTTIAIVFGVFPLVIATGAGSVSRFDMGIVITTGMFFGTIFTLFIVPILYYTFSSNRLIDIQHCKDLR